MLSRLQQNSVIWIGWQPHQPTTIHSYKRAESRWKRRWCRSWRRSRKPNNVEDSLEYEERSSEDESLLQSGTPAYPTSDSPSSSSTAANDGQLKRSSKHRWRPRNFSLWSDRDDHMETSNRLSRLSHLTSKFVTRNVSNYALRDSANKLVVPFPRTNYMNNSFSYSGAILWNSLPYNIRESSSLHQFKTPSPSIFLKTRYSWKSGL